MTDLETLKQRAANKRTITVPLRIDKTETRNDGKRRLVGHAAVWNSESEDLGGFVEILRPNCFRQALAKNPRLLLVWNHNLDAPLARAPDTLEVSEDSEGLRFSATLPDTTAACDVYELASKGIADQCSFSFSVDDQGQEWTRSGGRVVRYINSVKELFELTICATPAYEASHVSARSKQLAEVRAGAKAQAATGQRGRLRVREVSPYAPDSPYSWFRDLATVSAAEKHEHDAVMGGQRGVLAAPGTGIPHPIHGGPEEALQRLAASAEHRTVTSGGVSGPFIPTGAPAFVAELFSESARARAALAGALPHFPLPDAGMTVTIPGFLAGPTVSDPAEAGAVSSTDFTSQQPGSPVTLVSGNVDVSRQWLDRVSPGADVVLARELGRALAEEADIKLLTGTGTGQELQGLLSLSGATAAAYADASPTQAECWTALMSAYSSGAAALGVGADIVLLAPRRSAWLFNWRDTAGAQVKVAWPCTPLIVPSMPLTGGSGTNEDKIVFIRSEELPIALGDVTISVALGDFSGSGSLVVRAEARQYIAAGFGRRPEAVTVVSGTGLGGVTFT